MYHLVLPVLACEAFAQISLKKESFMLGCVGYTMVTALLLDAYRSADISTFNTLWSALSILSAGLIGTSLFGEDLTPRKTAAMALVLVAICIM